MTTKAAAELYLAQHKYEVEGKKYAFYNPKNKNISELPFIYGFNNGGNSTFLHAVLMAEDGTELGGHACSDEGYMESDLGILEGTRPDRHEAFREHYPDGYKMHFVGHREVKTHPGLQKAFDLNKNKGNKNV
jgi:hypothetical protein